MPPHTTPSTMLQLEAPPGGCPHVPNPPEPGTLQSPPQQSAFDPQTSPFCPQNDDATQTWLEQSCEQQPALAVHALPSVLQDVLSGVHVLPAPHVPLQHSGPVVQARPSDVHAGKAQTWFVHTPLQQSEAWLQPPPRLRHEPPESGLKGLPVSPRPDGASRRSRPSRRASRWPRPPPNRPSPHRRAPSCHTRRRPLPARRAPEPRVSISS